MDLAILRLAQARRVLLLQGRLRSNEPTQIFVCAAFGALIGALTAGLHHLVDWAHQIVFNIAGNHFRLIARINYRVQAVYILKILTHKEYDEGAWKS